MFVLFTIRKISKDIVRIVKWHPHPIRADLRMVNSIRIRKFADADTRYPRILRMLPQPMLKTTPIGPLVREAGLGPAEALLEDRQLGYTTRLLSLPDDHPAKKVLPASFREGDQHVQPGEQTPGNRM